MRIPLKIGIRNLVDFSCRSGDLGTEGGPGASALQGLITHQKIQRRHRHEAIAERSIKLEQSIDEFDIQLSGRIDLLFENEQPPRIEEIKTVYRPANSSLPELDPTHWAQVKCYAACYAMEKGFEQLVISLNQVNLFNLEEYRLHQQLSQDELSQFLSQLLTRYLDWQRLLNRHRQIARLSAQKLRFPFPDFRPRQREFAAQVYRNIQLGNRLMVEAPTGSGKTMSTLFPAVKALGAGLADQLIYLSAKTSGQNEALKAAATMNQAGLRLSYLVIQAKAKSCPCNIDIGEIDASGKCRRCIGFFDRLTVAREDLLKLRTLDSTRLKNVADQYQLCPFELSLQMLPWCDIVICDFNYVFDPLVQLSYFKTDSKAKVLLIDEIHNLVDRARSMYSATMSRVRVKQAIAESRGHSLTRALRSYQNSFNSALRGLTQEEVVSSEVPVAILGAGSRFIEKMAIDDFADRTIAAQTLEFVKAVMRFQCIGNLYQSHHRTIAKKPLAEREIKLLCLNAFDYLGAIYPLFQSVCGFSATLSPAAYFSQALGFGDETFALRLDSSFPAERLSVSLCSYVDTRYRQRETYIDSICATIQTCFESRAGNYLVFFTSYFFLQKVHQRFAELYPQTQTLLQDRATDDSQRLAFLAQFFEQQNSLGFAIMGGIYAEGIDYHGDSLIGAIVVGVGLPQANTEQRLIEADFNRLGLNGFDFTYLYPGMIRVQQSAGRVIRSASDRGIVILLDRRFSQAEYRQQLPPHWQGQTISTLQALRQSLDQFWSSP